MAVITVHDENRSITGAEEISQFLQPFGIWYENWPLEGRVSPDAESEEILSAYQPEIDILKERGGFVTADVINVNPDTPNLDEMLAKFDKEHTHSEDEVRFTIRGRGVFHIHPEDGPVFSIQVESGDLINVPRGTKHWFTLCDDRTIRCIRLFENPSGWTPEYVDNSVHCDYKSMCFGPDFVKAETQEPTIKL